MIIAVDFDGTCVKHRYPMVGEDVDGAVSVLKELVRKGHKTNLYIDDAALGIPLIEPEDDRDYVDWNRVRDILITKNVI